jgi:hypothetical protein
MRKMSREAEKQKWAALEGLVDARDAIALEVMREVFARLPYGQKFTLSDGSVAHLSKLSEPELCPNESSDYFQRPQFGVDVVIEGGKLDHIEISAFQTGSGMSVDPKTAQPNAGTHATKPDGGDAAEMEGRGGKWAASHRRGAGGHSASGSPRTRPQRPKREETPER